LLKKAKIQVVVRWLFHFLSPVRCRIHFWISDTGTSICWWRSTTRIRDSFMAFFSSWPYRNLKRKCHRSPLYRVRDVFHWIPPCSILDWLWLFLAAA
jgi:hypothetical protein